MKKDGNNLLSEKEKVQRLYDVEVVKLLRENNIKDMNNVSVVEQAILANNKIIMKHYHIIYDEEEIGTIEINENEIRAIII